MYIVFAILILVGVFIGSNLKFIAENLEAILSEIYRHFKFIFKPKARKYIKLIKKKLVNYCCERDVNIRILPIYQIGEKDKLAMGTARKSLRIITYSSIWMEKLADGDRVWEIAFEQTVGHELGHRKDLSPKEFCNDVEEHKVKFFNWVQECRCDFYGICFLNALYSNQISRDDINLAFKEKMHVYQPVEEERERACMTHPSWEFHYKMIAKYQNFNADVIHEIAKEAKMTDKEYEKELTALNVFDIQADKLIALKNS